MSNRREKDTSELIAALRYCASTGDEKINILWHGLDAKYYQSHKDELNKIRGHLSMNQPFHAIVAIMNFANENEEITKLEQEIDALEQEIEEKEEEIRELETDIIIIENKKNKLQDKLNKLESI